MRQILLGLLLAALMLPTPDARARQHEHHAAPPPAPVKRADEQPARPASPTGPALSLDEVLARLRESNPSLDAMRWAARAADIRIDASDQLPDPMVSGMFMGGAGRMARSEWMAEQSFPWPGTLAGRRNLAEATATSAVRMTDVATADLEFAATETYLRAAAIDRKLEHLAHFGEELRGFEAAAAAKYEVGSGPQQAILRLQLEKNAVLERIGLLQRERAERMESLRRLVGDVPDSTWLDRPLDFPDELRTADIERVSTADPGNDLTTVDEAVLDAAQNEAEARIRLAELSFKPSFSARVSWVEGSIMRNGRDAVGIGGAVMIPLWREGRQAELEGSRADRNRIEAESEVLELRLDTERSAARSRILHDRRLLQLIDGTLIPQAEVTHQATSSAYTNGRADYLDLVDAERMLLDLRLSRVDRLLELSLDEAMLARLYRRTESGR